MTAADDWADLEALRESIARIVWPSAFDDRDDLLAQAVAWEDRDPALHTQRTRRLMAAGYREKAAAAIHPALAKADRILKLIEAARRSDDVGEGSLRRTGWPIRVFAGHGDTEQQRRQVAASEAYKRGDMVRVWVSEGDLYMNPNVILESARHPVTPAGEEP